jgi:hypothetical protein
LAYLANVFGILNSLNISLQVTNKTILEAEERFNLFKRRQLPGGEV